MVESLHCSPEITTILLIGYSESEVKSLSRVRLFETLRTVAYQAPPSMGFSRQREQCEKKPQSGHRPKSEKKMEHPVEKKALGSCKRRHQAESRLRQVWRNETASPEVLAIV